MIVGSIKENTAFEKRVSLTPESAKNIIGLGLKVCVEKGYAIHLGINDEDYRKIGVEIKNSPNEVFSLSNLITKVNCPNDDEISSLKNNTILVGMLNPSKNKSQIGKIINKKVKPFSLELLPRITRAQSMDVLSSQSNLAGYRAVVDCVAEFERAVPMMMTAAGTVPAAKVLVIGAGVAGLQAIATAKRLGAIVSATDVRSASKEQVESLGGKFLAVEQSEDMETAGGYAKEASDDYKKKQSEMMKEALKKNDIVICTALIPGKSAPRILTEDLVKLMKPGSIVYDLAAEQEVTPTEYFIPIYLLQEFSNFITSEPYPIQDLLNIFFIALISSLPREGLNNLIVFVGTGIYLKTLLSIIFWLITCSFLSHLQPLVLIFLLQIFSNSKKLLESY